MKDEREILTRQTVTQKLVWESKRSIVNALVILLLSGIFIGLFYWLCALGMPAEFGILKVLLPLIVFSPFLITCVFSFIRALVRMNRANQGKFTVTEEILTEIKDNQFSLIQLILYGGRHTLFGSKHHLRHVFQFESGKTFIANVDEYKNTRLDTAAEYSSPGDSFFLVSYNDAPNKIILLFSSKTYNYKGDN